MLLRIDFSSFKVLFFLLLGDHLATAGDGNDESNKILNFKYYYKNVKYCSTTVLDKEFRKKENDFLYLCTSKEYVYVLKLFK